MLLALASLAICLLLWVNGLLASLDRPSVANALERRQKELAALAAPAVPESLRPQLLGGDPEVELLELLNTQLNEPPIPQLDAQVKPQLEPPGSGSATMQLERALLERRHGQQQQARLQLQQLSSSPVPLPAGQQELLQALLAQPSSGPKDGSGSAAPTAAERQRLLLATPDPLLRRLACEGLGGPPPSCRQAASEQRALLQLLAVNLLPLLALLIGVGLLLRQLWLRWRGQAPALAPLVGPRLSLLDLTLLVAGGFVVLGEVLTPLLVAAPLERLLLGLGLEPIVRQGGLVLGLYLALMSAPVLILMAMLANQGLAPEGGWLQFRWRPLALNLRRAVASLLMVLPLVSLVGWAGEQIWGDPGGSNPLLELVLNSRNPWALGCFAFTALVLAPLFEETIFRGVLLPVVSRSFGPLSGVLLSSAVFGIAHLSLGELPPLFVLGLGLGWLRLQSGRLGASVLMHGLWNGLTFLNLLLLGA
ncbi:MAG: type II CAAX endopeptidase family protein [Prochlorococcaceae cyanobacterium]